MSIPQLNQVTAIGRLVKDPVPLVLESRRQVCGFRLAINQRFRIGGKHRRSTVFIQCEASGKTAANVSKVLSKGDLILITGALAQRRWRDESTNKVHDIIKIQVLGWQLLEGQEPAGED